MTEVTGKPRLAKATLISLGVALVLLVTLVLPAEYGVDPLGTGEALGLIGLSRTEGAAVAAQEGPLRSDAITFELAPFESVEYKYRLESGSSVSFTWESSGEVVYDFHAEPDGAEEGYAESFDQGRGTQISGTYTAPFPGIHGWFWENRTVEDVTVTLVSSGFYSASTEFRGGFEHERFPAALSPTGANR